MQAPIPRYASEAEFVKNQLRIFKTWSGDNILLRINTELFPGNNLAVYTENFKKIPTPWANEFSFQEFVSRKAGTFVQSLFP